MFKRILVPLDGSALATRALPYAEFLAQRAEGELALVRAVETWTLLDGGLRERREHELTEEAERQLSAAVEKAKAKGLSTSSIVKVGEAAMVIAQARQSNDSDIIVMSTHGRGGLGHLAYGSVAERVLRLGACPVLLIPPEAEAGWRTGAGGTIVTPLDGSALSEEALAPACELADLFGASLTLLQVIEPPNPAAYNLAAYAPAYPYLDVEQWAEEAKPYIEGIARQLRSKACSVQAETLIGYAAATIDQLVRAKKAIAVVMASHGRSGIARMVLGSVAQGVVQRTSVPVLVIRPVAVRENRAELVAASGSTH